MLPRMATTVIAFRRGGRGRSHRRRHKQRRGLFGLFGTRTREVGRFGRPKRTTWTPDTQSCDIVADVLGVDIDTVLTLAGHRPHIDEPAPDDRLAAMFSRLRRLKLDED